VLHNDELYRTTVEYLLLKHLDSDQAHEDICDARQMYLRLKWLLRRFGFYWPTMMVDLFLLLHIL
jgi:hypothetical protein